MCSQNNCLWTPRLSSCTSVFQSELFHYLGIDLFHTSRHLVHIQNAPPPPLLLNRLYHPHPTPQYTHLRLQADRNSKSGKNRATNWARLASSQVHSHRRTYEPTHCSSSIAPGSRCCGNLCLPKIVHSKRDCLLCWSDCQPDLNWEVLERYNDWGEEMWERPKVSLDFVPIIIILQN